MISNLPIVQGATVEFTVTVKSTGGFDEPIDLDLDLPPILCPDIEPNPLPPPPPNGTPETKVKITVPEKAPVGEYSGVLIAKSRTHKQEVPFELTITAKALTEPCAPLRIHIPFWQTRLRVNLDPLQGASGSTLKATAEATDAEGKKTLARFADEFTATVDGQRLTKIPSARETLIFEGKVPVGPTGCVNVAIAHGATTIADIGYQRQTT